MLSNERLFELALNLQEPWYVKRIEFNTAAGELHMHIDFRKGSLFPCQVCGEPVKVHDTIEQTWRHLNFFQYECLLHAKVPRVDIGNGKVRLVSPAWKRTSLRPRLSTTSSTS